MYLLVMAHPGYPGHSPESHKMVVVVVVVDRNADGSRILEFADGLNLVICNTLFVKQESHLVTYAAVPVKSMVDYIIV